MQIIQGTGLDSQSRPIVNGSIYHTETSDPENHEEVSQGL